MLEIPKKSHTIYGKSQRNKHLLNVWFSQKLNSSQPSCFDFNGSQKFKLQELIFI